jgi:hypothetical protein
MLNSDQIVLQILTAIVIKAIDFLFGQIGEWLKERHGKRKQKQRPKTRRRH